MSEISVAGYENNEIGLHFDRKLERVDRHHNVHVRLVTPFLSGRPVFGHNHEAVGAQPLHKFILLVAFFLPDWHRGWKSGINNHLDQPPSGARTGQKFTQLYPIKATPHRARSEERRVGKECRSRWSRYH